jgi:hypothetical protein
MQYRDTFTRLSLRWVTHEFADGVNIFLCLLLLFQDAREARTVVD